MRLAVGDDVGFAWEILQKEITGYASNYFYRSFFEQTGFAKEMAEAQMAMGKWDSNAADQAITREMQG